MRVVKFQNVMNNVMFEIRHLLQALVIRHLSQEIY